MHYVLEQDLFNNNSFIMKDLTKRYKIWNNFFSFGLILFSLSFIAFYQINTDPVARLGALSGGEISAEDFKEHEGLNAVIDDKDKIRECKITGFYLVRVAKKQDPVEVIQHDEKFNKKSKALVAKATTGDIYYIDNVRAKCPGDAEERKINSLVFRIK